MKKSTKNILWIIFILTFFALTTIYIFDYNINVKRLSSKTEAIITDIQSSKAKIWNCSYYEFEINNKQYSGKYCSFKKYEIGDILVIKYDPNKPENNFEEKADNDYSYYSVLPLLAIFIFIFEFIYIQEKLLNKKNIDIEEKNTTLKKIFKIIKIVFFISLILTILILSYSINHYVMSSIKIFIYFTFIIVLVVFKIFSSFVNAINKIENNPTLLSEIQSSEGINCELSSVYFSKERLIIVGFSLKFINYSDIIAMRKRYVGKNNNCNISIMTKNFKIKTIVNVSLNNIKCCDKIIDELRKKVPNILNEDVKEDLEIINQMKNNKHNF